MSTQNTCIIVENEEKYHYFLVENKSSLSGCIDVIFAQRIYMI